jgi:hypothetical protein
MIMGRWRNFAGIGLCGLNRRFAVHMETLAVALDTRYKYPENLPSKKSLHLKNNWRILSTVKQYFHSTVATRALFSTLATGVFGLKLAVPTIRNSASFHAIRRSQ